MTAPTVRFIDLYMKSGLYVTEIAKRLFKNTRHFYNSDDDCIKHILEHQVYGLAPTNILYKITLSTIFSGTDGLDVETDNIKQYDLLTDAKNGTAKQAVMALFNNSGDSYVQIRRRCWQSTISKWQRSAICILRRPIRQISQPSIASFSIRMAKTDKCKWFVSSKQQRI